MYTLSTQPASIVTSLTPFSAGQFACAGTGALLGWLGVGIGAAIGIGSLISYFFNKRSRTKIRNQGIKSTYEKDEDDEDDY